MKSVLKKCLAITAAFCMLFTLAPATAYAENTTDTENGSWTISKSKTATNLDENFTSEITLSLPSAEEELMTDVVFVLDKSTSTDVEDEMIAMLQQLNDQISETNATVKVGIVIFNRNANNVLELTELNDANMDQIVEAIRTDISSGTNTHAGLLAGQAMLDADTAVSANRKYMIFVSDGLTYLFDADVKAINSQQSATGEYGIMAGNDCWGIRHTGEGGDQYVPEDWSAYLADVAAHLDEVQPYIQSYDNMSQDNHIPRGNTELPTTVDVALYKTYTVYQEMVNSGYNCYAVLADSAAAANYPWGQSFMNDLSGNKEVNFSDIQKEIYYLLDAGSTVEDYMGYVKGEYDFDFVNQASSMRLMVGDESYEAVKIEENIYGFKPIGESGEYAFVVEYVPGEGAEEHFVWHINEAVSNFAPVQLTYEVVLTNPSTEPGTYGTYDADGSQGYEGLYTNLSATLYPVDSNGTAGSAEAFAQPTVSYTVEDASEPSDPNDPSESGEPQDPSAPTTSEDPDDPETGISDTLALWGILFGASAALVTVLSVKRRADR